MILRNLLHVYLLLSLTSLFFVKKLGFFSLYDDLLFFCCFFILLISSSQLIRFGKLFAISLACLAFILFLSLLVSSNNSPLHYLYWDYIHPFLIIFVFYNSFVSISSLKHFVEQQCRLVLFLTLSWLVLALFVPFFDFSNIATSDSGPDSLRLGAFIGNPNTLAYVLLLFYPISLIPVFDINIKTSYRKLFPPAAYILLIFLTTSRSAFLSLIVLSAFMVFNSFNRLRLASFLKFFTLFLFGFFPVILFVYNKGILLLDRFSLILFTDTARFILWENFRNLYSSFSYQQQLFGSGPSFLSRIEGVIFDSYYYKILLELGIIGLACYILIICSISFFSARYYLILNVRNFSLYSFSFIFPSSCLIVLLAGYSSQIMDVFPFNIYFFSLCGMSLKFIRLAKTQVLRNS